MSCSVLNTSLYPGIMWSCKILIMNSSQQSVAFFVLPIMIFVTFLPGLIWNIAFSHTDCFIKLCLPETIWLNSIWPWESTEQWRYAEWLLTEIGLRWPLTISNHICILCPISNLNSLFLASWSLIYRLLEWFWRHIIIHPKTNPLKV